MAGGRPARPSSHAVLGRQGISFGGLVYSDVQRRLLPSPLSFWSNAWAFVWGFDLLLLSDQFLLLSFPLGSWIETHRACSSLQCPSC